MSAISVIAQPPSPEEDLDEELRFNETMAIPTFKIVIDMMIENRGLPLTEPHRFEVAKLCALTSTTVALTGINIHLFALNEIWRFEVGQICLRQEPALINKIFQNCDLTEEHRFELIKLNIKMGWSKPSNWIKSDENKLSNEQSVELIKLYLFPDLQDSEDAFRMHLTKEQHLEIAKYCIQNDRMDILENMPLFDLDSEQRLDLAILSAKKNLAGTMIRIDSFNLSGKHLTEFFIFVQEKNEQIFKDLFLRIIRRELENVVEGFRGSYNTTLLCKLGWVSEKEWLTLMKDLRPEEQQEIMRRLMHLIVFVWEGYTIKEQMVWVSEQRFFARILASRAYLDDSLIKLSMEVAKQTLSFDALSDTFPPLLRLPLAKMITEGVNFDSLQLNKKDLKDSKKIFPFVHSMVQLAEDGVLLPEEKTQIIQVMTKKTTDLSKEINNLTKKMREQHLEVSAGERKEQLTSLQLLKNRKNDAMLGIFFSARDLSIILGCLHNKHLQDKILQGFLLDTSDLEASASEAFQSILPLPAPVDDFSKRYRDTFGSYRQPNALQIYATRLNSSPLYRPALESLGEHVFAVLYGIYLSERYDHTKNPHLQRLHDYDQDLLQNWQKNSSKILELKDFPGFSIHETGDAEDILLCGTEIKGSCQNIEEGNLEYNQGLVGYLRNGQTRLIAVKDKKGRIVARSLLRLLWDEKQERPVLFLEKLYSNMDNPVLGSAIIEKAKEVARRLKCPLTRRGLARDEYRDPHFLLSLGGVAPCEYVDGAVDGAMIGAVDADMVGVGDLDGDIAGAMGVAGGLQRGPYKVNATQLLYDPLIDL